MSTWTKGMWSDKCPCGQRVCGQIDVHTCPLGVGGWSKRGKNLSKWLLNAKNTTGNVTQINGKYVKPICNRHNSLLEFNVRH